VTTPKPVSQEYISPAPLYPAASMPFSMPSAQFLRAVPPPAPSR